MKRFPLALGLASLLFAGVAYADTAQADDFGTARSCLAYGKKRMADNGDMLALLDRSKIDRQSVREERYDDQVGSQHIATQVSAGLRDGQRRTGLILCLFENGKPLYFYVHPASS
ncbi:MAG: hypothetical protein LBV73_10445 [Paraburkholderia sp.]|jgi:hypothetical protein|nr:hypothetical protein [Paraburkholderia sp.]